MALWIFLAIGSLFSLHLATFPGWFDAGELALALNTLGVSHPSGHPTYALFGKLFTLLPLGTVALRTSFLSAVSMAVGIVLSARILYWAIGFAPIPFSRVNKLFLMLAAATLLVLHPSLGLQATRTEVYSLQFAFSMIVLALALLPHQIDRRRWFYAGGFALGVAFATHPLLTVTLLPPLFYLLCVDGRGRGRLLSLTVLFFLLGTLVNLYLPIRAMTNPLLNWDHPSTLSRWFFALSARDYHQFFHSPVSSRGWLDWLKGDLWLLLPPVELVLACFGILGIFQWRGRKIGGFFLIAFVSSLGAWLSKNFFLQNPDAHAYILVPIVLSTVLAAIGAIWLLCRVRVSTGLAVLIAICLMVAGKRTIIGLGPASWAAHAASDAEKLSRHLDCAPAGALLETGSDHWVFPLWYRSYVEGRRPDVAIVGTGMLRASWYQKQLQERYGNWWSRPLWRESQNEDAAAQVGYLFGDQGNADNERKAFNEVCRSSNQNDPFEIRRSICAQVVINSVAPWFKQGKGRIAIGILEDFLGVLPTDLTCAEPKPISLPYPLSYREKDGFLVSPEEPIVMLLISYLGCERPDLAEPLFWNPLHAIHTDVRLIHAYSDWIKGNRKKARLRLGGTDATLNQREDGYLALARATLAWMDADRVTAEQELHKAQRFLPLHPAVSKLSESIQKRGKR